MSGYWVHTVLFTCMRIAQNMREIIYARTRTRLANNFKYGRGTQSNRLHITSSEANNPLCVLVTWDVDVAKFLTCHATSRFVTRFVLFFYSEIYQAVFKTFERL